MGAALRPTSRILQQLSRRSRSVSVIRAIHGIKLPDDALKRFCPSALRRSSASSFKAGNELHQVRSSEAPDELKKAAVHSQQVDAFPWHSGPFQLQGYLEALLRFIGLRNLSGLWRSLAYHLLSKVHKCERRQVPEVLFHGFRFAFIQAVRSIFVDSCKVPQPTLDPQASVVPTSDTHEIDYPALSDIFDSNCANVYEGVMQRFRERKHSVYLEIQHVQTVELQDFRLVVGPPRKALGTQSNLIRLEGPGCALVCDANKFLYGRGWDVANETEEREKFFVRNDETQAIIQGTEELVDAQHFVRFETDMELQPGRILSAGWQIVDIDSWNVAGPYWGRVKDPHHMSQSITDRSSE